MVSLFESFSLAINYIQAYNPAFGYLEWQINGEKINRWFTY